MSLSGIFETAFGLSIRIWTSGSFICSECDNCLRYNQGFSFAGQCPMKKAFSVANSGLTDFVAFVILHRIWPFSHRNNSSNYWVIKKGRYLVASGSLFQMMGHVTFVLRLNKWFVDMKHLTFREFGNYVIIVRPFSILRLQNFDSVFMEYCQHLYFWTVGC